MVCACLGRGSGGGYYTKERRSYSRENEKENPKWKASWARKRGRGELEKIVAPEPNRLRVKDF